MIAFHPMAPGITYGALVTGLDWEDLADESTCARLRDLFARQGMIVFRDMAVTPELQIALTAVFGENAIHPTRDQMGGSEHREIITMRHDKDRETTFEVDGRRIGAYVPWHYDAVFTPRLNRGGILRVTQLPDDGGKTGFIDKCEAYDALSDDLKARVEGLEIVYQMSFTYPFVPRTQIRIVHEGALVRSTRERVEKGDFPPVVHPLVFTHPGSNRKVLNLSPMFALGIAGMSKDDGDELLLELAYHINDETRAYFHDWRSSDELVLWDNWRMLHTAEGCPEDDAREVQRTTLAGDYALGRVA